MYKSSLWLPVGLMVALSACGGSGGVSSVFAEGDPVEDPSDLIGIRFPATVVGTTFADGVTDPVKRSTYSVEVTSETTARLTTPDGTINLTLNEIEGVFEAMIDDREITVFFLDFEADWVGLLQHEESSGPSSGLFAIGPFGFETPLSAVDDLIDAEANLVYEGISTVLLEADGSGEAASGVTLLEVDFGTGTVVGSLWQSGAGGFTIQNGTISDGGFDGTVAVTGDLATDLTIETSDVSALFYGTTAQEVGGTFEGSGTYLDSDATFGGAFIGGAAP